jgi:ABC-type transporter Mla MlaB component
MTNLLAAMLHVRVGGHVVPAHRSFESRARVCDDTRVGYPIPDVDLEEAVMLEVRPVDSGLAVSGALDHDGGRVLLSAIASVPGDVRVDASQVQRIDGAGLTALAIARNRCRADGRAFVLTAIAPEAVKGLRIGDHLASLFAAPGPEDSRAPDHQSTDTDAGRSAPRPAGGRRRLSIHLHRHQET